MIHKSCVLSGLAMLAVFGCSSPSSNTDPYATGSTPSSPSGGTAGSPAASGGVAGTRGTAVSGTGTGGNKGSAGSPGASGNPSGTNGASGSSAAGASGKGGTTAMASAGAKDSHFPLVDGATWTYHHTNPNKPPWDEIVTIKTATYMGKPAFIYSDQEDAQGLQTHTTLVVNGTGVYRAYKEVAASSQTALTVSYDPAFLRYDEAWNMDGQTMTLTDNWIQQCIQMSAASKCAPGATTPGMTTHTYTVLKASIQVTSPAGTFDAVEIQRVDPATKETKLYWFARGVGKVREETPAVQAVEELVSYQIP